MAARALGNDRLDSKSLASRDKPEKKALVQVEQDFGAREES